ncbi:MAG: Dabb family protein [Myxococcales bacterium]|nr:Dabb family protein [Myxococcales bacterium]
MIERVVLIKLKPEYATDEHRRAIAATTATTLPGAQGVRAVRVAVAADGRTRREWDVCIEVVLDDIEAVERYRIDPVHRAYADDYLAPFKQKIHVYNFERHPPPG